MTPRFRPVDVPSREGGGGADGFARALVQGLERPDPRLKPWGAVGSAVAGFLSLGAAPILLWHDRFRDFVDEERHQLRRFADWLRLHSARPETMDLRVAGEDLGCRPLLSALSILSVVAVLVLFVASLGPGASVSRGDAARPLIESVLGHTYGFDNSEAWQVPLSPAQRLFAAWTIGISAAYLFHWVQVQAHAADVRRFVRYANRILKAEGMARVPVPRVGIGLSFLWLVAAVVLASQGAFWAAALAVAGGAQQRYMAGESVRVRRALAARLRELQRIDVPPARAATSGRRCPHVRCLAPLPARSRFCPRCGHNVDPDAARAKLWTHGKFESRGTFEA